jgi:sulfhydrogenase subunit beta (sulfur reductase)
MNSYRLNAISTLFQHLATEHKMFEPQHLPGSSDLHWLPSSNEPTGQYSTLKKRLPLAPPKGLLFPEREILFRFDGQAFIETVPDVKPQILFGLLSCDLCAISYQDQFFKDDNHYQTRRSATLLVGFDCLVPCDGGLCSTVDAGPFVRDSTADLILHPKGEEWLLIAASKEGDKLINALDLPPAPADWLALRAKSEAKVVEAFPSDNHIKHGIEKINQASITDEQWQRLGLQCLTCSGCTSLCPTCSCFTTFDQKSDESSEAFQRERCWDSCLYEAFQRETSGHNPSEEAGQRLQRYWFHKFSDHYAKEFNRYGCVGCGRCEQTCPGGIGIHSIMRRLEATS